ncbi:MAG: hypothetical protein V1826_02810, partial [bacterium]
VLNTIETAPVVQDAAALISTGSDIVYFSRDYKFIKTGSPPQTFSFEKLPASTRSVLASTTSLYLAKPHEGGNAWLLGLGVGNKRWLAIIEPDGYRGYLVGAPLSQVKADDAYWIDADRLMFVINGSVYTLDLTLNKINEYAEGVSGATHAGGKTYFVTRDKLSGKYMLMKDANMFDDRPATAVSDTIPVGRHHAITIIDDDHITIVAETSGSQGLWLLRPPAEEPATVVEPKQLQLIKLASSITSSLYDYLDGVIYYTVGDSLGNYELDTNVANILHSFPAPPIIIGKRNQTLFIVSDKKLLATDPSGSNIYDLGSIAGASVFLSSDSQRLWVLNNGQVAEWKLRGSSVGPFGILRPHPPKSKRVLA